METKCTYCGFESDIEREHVIPAVWFGNRTFKEHEQWIVPACRQCNRYAGSSVFFSIPEKAKHICKRYKSRASKILKAAFWSDDDLKGMGRMLRLHIEESTKTKQLILRRIAHLDAVSSLDIDYMRPKWIEARMKELQKEYERAVRKIKKREKNRLQKEGTKTAKTDSIKT